MSSTEGPPLFREASIKHRRMRLYGSVSLPDDVIPTSIIGLIFVVIILLAICAAFTKFPRSEIIRGFVVAEKPVTKVFSSRAGVIASLQVKEGDPIKKGELLATVLSDPSVDQSLTYGSALIANFDVQMALISSQKNALDGSQQNELRRLEQSISDVEVEINNLRAQIMIQHDLLDSARSMEVRAAPAAQDGFISKNDFERLRQETRFKEQQLFQIKQQMSQKIASVSQLRFQIKKAQRDHLKDAADLDLKLSSLTQQKAKATVDRLVSINAPVDGIVTGLNITEGFQVDVKAPLLSLASNQNAFEVIALAPTKAVGLIKKGQKVKIMFDAFPYGRYGTFSGSVNSVARSITLPGETEIPFKLDEAAYRVNIRPDFAELTLDRETYHLSSGMTLSAAVRVNSQSAFEKLLAPAQMLKN